ncbi:TniQ family protein [Streptomyces sp. NPDC091287]|uniref:TniQ family protein n=1 Tax=Streptomyces sp. NPDC091287 TaxID=3365988 RepID=UPI0037FAA08F
MPEYLYRRTHGIVGLLRRLIEDGLTKAMESGLENLTIDLLDEIAINLGNVPGKDGIRDAEAGEIPRRGHCPTAEDESSPEDPEGPERAQHGSRRPRHTSGGRGMTLRPLPRSLDPLEDETFVGFTLRLARHNGTTPEQVAARLGLMDGLGETPGAVSPWLLVDMDKPRLARAARAANLTVAETDKLLLAPIGHRYGLVSRRYRPWTSPRQLDRPNRWILVRTSQYCPSCLAGDGSPQEALNGGAWRRSWRLPVVFACVRHRQLLHRVCPACRTPGQFARAGMIARPGMEELHPAQCRSPSFPGSDGIRLSVCGTDLSRVGPACIPEDADSFKALLALQGRLDELLATNGPQNISSCGRLVPVA